jgi:hypothetical protein
MKTGYWIAAAVAGVALVGAWRLLPSPAAVVPGSSATEAAVAQASKAGPPPAPGATTPTLDAAPPDAAQVQQWIADTNNADAARRVVAIDALARAPRDQALPVLHRLVTNGDPVTDRPAALNSLRELALDQGDADGGIRQAIREVIYHGDDEALASSAQDALDVVEESEMK